MLSGFLVYIYNMEKKEACETILNPKNHTEVI